MKSTPAHDDSSALHLLSDEQLLQKLRTAESAPNEEQDTSLSSVLERLRATPPDSSAEDEAADAPAEPAGGRGEAAELLEPPLVAGDLGALGGYRVIRELGRGGMGVVFLGWDGRLGRDVAIKLLHPERKREVDRQRFLHKAQAAASLTHDHAVRVYSVETAAGDLPFIVMQHVPGESLRDRIAEGPLDPREAAGIAEQIARALESAHQGGLVHRDVKPANILLDDDGRARISDFGLVRYLEHDGEDSRPTCTTEHASPGTPQYMSPEQIQSPQQVDGRSDVYSLGVTLYESLTAAAPFRGMPHMIAQQVLHCEPAPPRQLDDRIPRDLEVVCLRAIGKEPLSRYQSAAELADDLRRWLDGEPIKARPLGVGGRLARWCRRNKLAAALLACVVLLTVAGSAAVIRQWRRAESSLAELREQQRVAAAMRQRANSEEQRAEDMSRKAQRESARADATMGNVIVAVAHQQTTRNPSPSQQEMVQMLMKSFRDAMVRSLPQYEGDPDQRVEMASTHLAIASCSLKMNDRDRALGHYQTAAGIYRQLAVPAEAHDQRQCLAVCHHQAGLLMDGDEAERSLVKALEIRLQLLRTNPEGLHYQLDCADTTAALAARRQQQGRDDEARQGLDDAERRLRLLLERREQFQNNAHFRDQLSQCLQGLSAAWLPYEPARAAWAEAVGAELKPR